MPTTHEKLDEYELPPVPYVYRDNYLEGSFQEGLVRTSAGNRVVVLPEEMLVGLHRALIQEAGAAWSIISYTCGRRWGERLLDTIESEWRSYYGKRFESADFPIFEAWLKAYFSYYGWADLEIDFEQAPEGIVEFILTDSVLEVLLADLDRTHVNEIFAGVLAALVSRLAGRELECLEVESALADAERSRLAVALPERVEEARRVRVDGGSPEKIREVLTH